MTRTEDRGYETDVFEHQRPVDCQRCGRVWSEVDEVNVEHDLPICPQCGQPAEWPPGYPHSEVDEEWESAD
jgi:hypothetical protein